MTVRPRDDVALMAGYHSPQVDVAVRLNTNESPEPPPAAWEADLAAAMGEIDWHRYPDRAALELRTAIGAQHGVGPEQVFAAITRVHERVECSTGPTRCSRRSC